MNARTLLLACNLLAAVSVARAGEQVDKTLAADADGVVAIDNTRGSLDIGGWDRNEVQVTGELDDLAEALVFERDGKRTRIEVKLPDDNVDSGDGSTLTIRVPAASRLEVRGVSTDTTLAGVGGGVVIRTISGDVVASGVGGELSIKTVSGDLKLEAGGSRAVHLKSVSGDIRVKADAREIELGTVSGDVELELGEFDSLGINTVSGDLAVSGRLARGGRVECKTVSGSCGLRLGKSIDARISVRTGPGGEIVNHVNATAPEEEFPAQQRLDTTLGDGSGSITASTVSGEITLGEE
jgi:DUF4097 and DUF4098 domain-containing protein YvlB